MGAIIFDSILTPFSWYSLLPVVGFTAFLFLVAAYQRGKFYWITDRAGNVLRCRRKPKSVRERHVPWFIAGNTSPAAHGIGMTTFQSHPGSPVYEPEVLGSAASSSGAATVLLNSGGPGHMDSAPPVPPVRSSGSHVRNVPAMPVLIKVTDLSEWSASI